MFEVYKNPVVKWHKANLLVKVIKILHTHSDSKYLPILYCILIVVSLFIGFCCHVVWYKFTDVSEYLVSQSLD